MTDAEKLEEQEKKAKMEKQAKQEAMDGSPAFINFEHIVIRFQLGPVKEFGENGCQMEDVLAVLVERLEGFQRGQFKCRENAIAITKLQEAVHWLEHRTRERQRRGVAGKNEA